MSTKTDCLQLIRLVREAGKDPESAYLVRTRLRRALIGSTEFAHLTKGHDGANTVVHLCDTIRETTLRLCQPSEAFDARWQRDWEGHVQRLTELEEAVGALVEL